MKKLIIIIVLATSILSASSQVPEKDSYIENNTMTAFHGEWRWVDGIDTVQIYLSTRRIGNEDRLVGWHFYKKGNVTVESSYSSIYYIYAKTIVSYKTYGNGRKVFGHFTDLSKKKHTVVNFSLNKSLTQLRLSLKELKRSVDAAPVAPGFTIPENIMLTKIIAD